MLIDTHTHLNMDPLVGEWETVLQVALQSGVTQMVVPGADIGSSSMAITQAQAAAPIFAAVGIQSETVDAVDETELTTALTKLVSLLLKPKVVALGEIGLDYSRQINQQKQRQAFRNQLELALTHHLPAIIHTRTEAAMVDALEDIHAVYETQPFSGVFHCFTGTQKLAEQMIEVGASIGVGGMITFANTQPLQEVVASLPVSSLVLETDAPWLAPVPHRGTVNSSARLPVIALKLAALCKLPPTEIMAITSRNACRLFPALKDHQDASSN